MYEKKLKVCGTRYKARSRGRSISRHLGFLSLRNAQTIEPTTGWAVDFIPQCKNQALVFTLEWSGARPMCEQW